MRSRDLLRNAPIVLADKLGDQYAIRPLHTCDGFLYLVYTTAKLANDMESLSQIKIDLSECLLYFRHYDDDDWSLDESGDERFCRDILDAWAKVDAILLGA